MRGHASRAHHAVICYWRFPERVTKGPELAGICATVRSSETTLLRGGGCFCAFFSGPEIPFPETETARGRDSVRMRVTPKEVRASGAGETTRRACR